MPTEEKRLGAILGVEFLDIRKKLVLDLRDNDTHH